MPFNKDTAAENGSKGGGNRWRGKAPGTNRNKQLKVSMTQAEYATITEKAAAAGLSKAEFIIQAANAYKV